MDDDANDNDDGAPDNNNGKDGNAMKLGENKKNGMWLGYDEYNI